MPEWSDERTGALVRMHADGMSASQIGRELGGVSRNAVLGKLYRLGIATARPKRTVQFTRVPKGRALRVIRTGNGGARIGSTSVYEMLPRREIPAEAIPVEQRKALMQLESFHCRWPYGEPGQNDFFFCGGEKIDGLPYCPMHARLAYTKAAA